jgi:hypothetical protein
MLHLCFSNYLLYGLCIMFANKRMSHFSNGCFRWRGEASAYNIYSLSQEGSLSIEALVVTQMRSGV